MLTSAAGKPNTPSSHRPSLRVEASSALPPLDALSWFLSSLSLPCSPCRPAHHRAEQHCAAPPAKSDAPPASSLELEPREALRRIVEASPTNSRANPLPSRSDLASSCRLPRRRRPPSAPHRRAASLLLLRPIEALGELSVPLLSLVRALDSIWPVVGVVLRGNQPPPCHGGRRRPNFRRARRELAAPLEQHACIEAIGVPGRVSCAAVRRRHVETEPPSCLFRRASLLAILRSSPVTSCATKESP